MREYSGILRGGGDIAKQEKPDPVPERGGVECFSMYSGCQPNKSISVDVYNKSNALYISPLSRRNLEVCGTKCICDTSYNEFSQKKKCLNASQISICAFQNLWCENRSNGRVKPECVCRVCLITETAT